jgi:transcriptional regulator with XRE-family HTH domain
MTMPTSAQAQEIVRRLREFREQTKLTIDELAERAGLSAREVAAIEGGLETPSVGQLLNLARVLGVSPGQLFQGGAPPRRIEVVRAGERWRVERASSESGTSLSYSYEALSYRLTEKLMQPFLIEVRLGRGEPVVPSTHEGEEFMYVLEGEMELEVSGEKIRLAAGDSCYFDSRLPHVLRALSAKPPRLIVVVATAWAAQTPPGALSRAF